jgi:hypothetical protein
MYLYLVVDCRTPDCEMIHMLKYLGEEGKIPEGVEVSMPAPMWIRCPKCELNHDYMLSQVRRMEYTEPPPSDYRDKI